MGSFIKCRNRRVHIFLRTRLSWQCGEDGTANLRRISNDIISDKSDSQPIRVASTLRSEGYSVYRPTVLREVRPSKRVPDGKQTVSGGQLWISSRDCKGRKSSVFPRVSRLDINTEPTWQESMRQPRVDGRFPGVFRTVIESKSRRVSHHASISFIAPQLYDGSTVVKRVRSTPIRGCRYMASSTPEG